MTEPEPTPSSRPFAMYALLMAVVLIIGVVAYIYSSGKPLSTMSPLEAPMTAHAVSAPPKPPTELGDPPRLPSQDAAEPNNPNGGSPPPKPTPRQGG
jgi:hypothetical protein